MFIQVLLTDCPDTGAATMRLYTEDTLHEVACFSRPPRTSPTHAHRCMARYRMTLRRIRKIMAGHFLDFSCL